MYDGRVCLQQKVVLKSGDVGTGVNCSQTPRQTRQRIHQMVVGQDHPNPRSPSRVAVNSAVKEKYHLASQRITTAPDRIIGF